MRRFLLFILLIGWAAPAFGAVLYQSNYDNPTPNPWNASNPYFSPFNNNSGDDPATVGGVYHHSAEILSPGRGGSGQRYVIWRGDGTQCGSADSGELSVILSSSEFNNHHKDFYTRFYMKIDQNFYWTGGSGAMKIGARGIFEASYTGSPVGTYVLIPILGKWGSSVSGMNFGFNFYTPASGDFGQSYNIWMMDNFSTYGMDDGNWHCVEWHIKLNSTTGSHDGVLEIFIDGVAVDLTHDGGATRDVGGIFNANLGMTTDHYFSVVPAPGMGNCGSSPPGGAFAHLNNANWAPVEYDDMIISTTYVGTGAPSGDTEPPTTPTNLQATAVSSSQINLTWTASTDNVAVTGYNIYRGGSLIGTSATTAYSDTGLTQSTIYSYTVSAHDAAGNSSAQSASASATTQASPGQTTILFENWESGNTLNWRADYVAGLTTVVTSPVYAGTYAVRMVSDDPGNYVHAFGDSTLRTGGPTTQVDDFTLEEYYRPTAFDAGATKMWLINAFESWSANYVLAEGQPKPHNWAPYYMTIYTNGAGQMIGQQVRADGLPGAPTGLLWHDWPQNVGSPVALTLNAWNKIKFRVKLNTPGAADGIFQMWINDVLKADYSTMDFRGSYTTRGWNHLMMSMHAFTGLPSGTYLYRDNITLSSGATVSDTTPPTRVNGSPSGTLQQGTTQTAVSLETNENATCRHSDTADTSYADMTDFTTTGATTHSYTKTGMADGQAYDVYVKCQDAVGNQNPDDYPIEFSVASSPPAPTSPIMRGVYFTGGFIQ